MTEPLKPTSTPTIAMAGASGFVGTHLISALVPDFRVRALSRSENVVASQDRHEELEWRQCDLYSLPKVTEALEGCRYGIYLVHSMAPSSRLVQSDFEDTDLLLADNFIRAAEAAGIEHVIYLSGLMPDGIDQLSPHLRSRLEVERVMRSRKVKVTVLRAGLIFGAGGSSFSLLVNLVRRLPVMILPAWVHSRTHSIDIENVCQAFQLCLEDPGLGGGIFDLGGHEAMRYRELIDQTAKGLGKKTTFIHFPFNCFQLSKHWVAFFGSVPTALVGPLQESLQYDLVAKSNPLLDRLKPKMVPFQESLARGVDGDGKPRPNPRSRTQSADWVQIKAARRVRSVQRMYCPVGVTAQQIASEYSRWLTERFRGVIDASADDQGTVRFSLFGKRLTLLEMQPTPYTTGNRRRCAFYITGGILSRRVDPPGRLEFRLFPDEACLIASIHGFAPTLPWLIYANSQARIHLRVMRAFDRHLRSRPFNGAAAG